jgi:hypothetical protein
MLALAACLALAAGLAVGLQSAEAKPTKAYCQGLKDLIDFHYEISGDALHVNDFDTYHEHREYAHMYLDFYEAECW